MYSVFNESSRRFMVDRKLNKFCLFNKIIGQDGAVDALADLCYKGLGRRDRVIAESVVLVGPPSSGKTTIVKTAVEILGITSVITDATQIKNNDDLANAVMTAWAKKGLDLPGEDMEGVQLVRLPATAIMVDELHALRDSVQEGLLKATERSDGMLFSKHYILDCRNVWWIGATTHWGDLLPAFRTRFRRIDLLQPTFSEVVQMVSKSFGWDMAVSGQIVKYGGIVPRECFSFGRSVIDASKRGGLTVCEAIAQVVVREGINVHGLKRQRVRILELLLGGEMILRSLASGVGCPKQELLEHWLPPMLQEGLVEFDGKYRITELGKTKL